MSDGSLSPQIPFREKWKAPSAVKGGTMSGARQEYPSDGTVCRRYGCRLVLLVALVLLARLPVWAQSGIAGVVRDTSGGVLPGVSVEAGSPVLIEKVRAAVTDSDGRYNIVDLRPGTYTVTFTLPGFTTFKRDGIVLPASFTATVNAELSVGGLEETITVSGEAPIVDVQTTAQASVLAKGMLDAIPNARLPQVYTILLPAVVGTGDVGRGVVNSSALSSMSIHGTRDLETQFAIDGISDRNMSNPGGAGVYHFINQGYVQEMVVSTGGAGAEQQMAGLVSNVIPKEGGNSFSGQFYWHFTNESLLGDNLTDELIAQGVQSTNSTRKQWSVNPSVGGPILQDKLWFFFTYLYADNEADAGIPYNLTPNAWVYTPDPNRPTAGQRNVDTSSALRLTWQATPRNKIALFHDFQPKYWYNRLISGTVSPEASQWAPYLPNYLSQVVWKSPVTSRFLLEAGSVYQNTILWNRWNDRDPRLFSGPPGSQPDRNNISATELTTGIVFRSLPLFGIKHGTSKSLRTRAAASYVTGTHAFKMGVDLFTGERFTVMHRIGDYTVSLRNGSPVGVTLWAPFEVMAKLNADLGVYAQDQWTLDRFTLNLGLRYDYLNSSVPPQDVPGNRWLPARHYDSVDRVPVWHDLSPRFGVSYDLFGTGRTAVKATLNRYVAGESIRIADANNPVSTSIVSANRDWTDLDGDFDPDCDFNNPAANGECGRLSDLNFGQNNPGATRYDPEYLEGFGARGYNWETSAAVQHELLRGLSLNVGYFRRWFGNELVTDNEAVTPADFDPYCITVPSDPRLPGGGGNEVCGYYDVDPAKFGASQNLVTYSDKFGTRTEIYNGVDVTISARWSNGAQVTGGTSTGRTALNTCFTIDSPQAQLFCDRRPPFQTQLKFMGTYPLPWYGIQLSGAFQNVPGPEISTTTLLVRNAQIAPSLGRNLASGPAGTVLLPIMPPGTLYADRWTKLDLRLTKNFQIRQYRIQGSLDIFNALNSSDTTGVNTRYGPAWLRPTNVLGARLFRLSGQIDF
jgi:hypothetical protein